MYSGLKTPLRSTQKFLRRGVCPSLSEVEDVPLKALCKTRILLVGFGYNETNLESVRKLTAVHGREAAASGATKHDQTMTWP